MGEFITVQVGQCGNQIGSLFWPLVLQEYGINNVPGGILRPNNVSSANKESTKLRDSFNSFFCMEGCDSTTTITQCSDLKKFGTKARAVLIDMEDSVVDRFHVGPLKFLFDKSCTIRNYPGSGNNWAEGFYEHGMKYQEKIENTLRISAEKCNHLLGFFQMYSVGGGTGSGLGSFVLQLLEDQFSNVDRFVTCVYPNGIEDVITCPYNVALATQYLTSSATCVFPVENRALLDIVMKETNHKKNFGTNDSIPFQDMNAVIVNMLLHVTSGSRFSGGLNVDLNDIGTNLVPFPNMHFVCSSVSPVVLSIDRLKGHEITKRIRKEIFYDCCHRNNQLLKVDPLGLNSRLLGASIIGRGEFSISDMRDYVDQLQTRAHFTPWSHQAIKVGLCGVPPTGHRASMLGLFNSSAMLSLFDQVSQNFIKLYQRKAHVHHYTKIDGFDLNLFDECKEALLANIENYKSISVVKEINAPRMNVL